MNEQQEIESRIKAEVKEMRENFVEVHMFGAGSTMMDKRNLGETMNETIIYKSDTDSKLKRDPHKYKLGTEIHCADGVILVRVKGGFEVKELSVSQRDWEQVVSDLESDVEPNDALKELAQTYKEQVG